MVLLSSQIDVTSPASIVVPLGYSSSTFIQLCYVPRFGVGLNDRDSFSIGGIDVHLLAFITSNCTKGRQLFEY